MFIFKPSHIYKYQLFFSTSTQLRACYPPSLSNNKAFNKKYLFLDCVESASFNKKAKYFRINVSSRRQPTTTTLVEYEVDVELWEALQVCDEEELRLLHYILFSPSPFSPAVKNIISESRKVRSRQSRESLMRDIETRFRFLAANSFETLRGEHPSYRETLLHIQRRFKIDCSVALETQDLESEIFLHLFESRAESDSNPERLKNLPNLFVEGDGMTTSMESSNKLVALKKLLAPLRYGKREIASLITKLSGALTISAIRDACLKRTGASMVMSNIKYQMAIRSLYTNGIDTLKKRAAFEAAQSCLTNTAMRCGTVNGVLSLLGPIMWATLGLDLVMKSLGTDYARIIKAVFSLGQIRLLRTYGFTKPKEE